MRNSRRVLLGVLLCGILVTGVESALGNGRYGKVETYKANLDCDEDAICTFLVEIQPALFRLNTINGKYKVVRMEIENRGESTILLSHSHDSVRFFFRESGEIRGILDLFSTDPDLWDSLPMDLRIELAYPERVEAGEPRTLYVFLPAPELDQVPERIEYRIHMISAQIELTRQGPVAAE